eukprot:10863-Heterococcus_DN1.PRE.1
MIAAKLAHSSISEATAVAFLRHHRLLRGISRFSQTLNILVFTQYVDNTACTSRAHHSSMIHTL